MLLIRIKEKKPKYDDNKTGRIVGMLIEDNFTVDEIIELLASETELDDRLQEAEEVLAEDNQ